MLAFEYPFLRMTDFGARQNNSHILSRANFAPLSCRRRDYFMQEFRHRNRYEFGDCTF